VGRVVLDASIVISIATPDDAKQLDAIAALDSRRADELLLPASAYTETLLWPMKAGKEAVGRLDRFLAEMSIEIAPISAAVARRAAELRSRRRAIALGDALVIAAGDVLKADEILTSDRSWRRVNHRVTVI